MVLFALYQEDGLLFRVQGQILFLDHLVRAPAAISAKSVQLLYFILGLDVLFPDSDSNVLLLLTLEQSGRREFPEIESE